MTRKNFKNKKIAYAGGGYRSRYQVGGLPNWLYKARGKAMRRKMQGGGMYADNTAASVGQGRPGDTSSIVFQESDPKLQAARLKHTQDVIAQQEAEGQQALAEASQIQEQGAITAEQEGSLAAQNVLQNIAAREQTVGALGQAAGLAPSAAKGTAIKGAMEANRLQRAANLASQGKDFGTLVTKGGGAVTTGITPAGKGITDASGALIEAGGKGSALGAGVKSFLGSGAGLGLLASGAGYGVKKLWADDDPTTADTGEVAGSALSSAGTGMALGSMIMPGIGTVAGGILGGLYGVGKSVFGAKKAKREQEKAIAKAEREYKQKVAKKVTKHNKELMSSFGSSLSAQRAGELKQKTYSGYDLGQNIIAQMGGMRMGMPRYGYAS